MPFDLLEASDPADAKDRLGTNALDAFFTAKDLIRR